MYRDRLNDFIKKNTDFLRLPRVVDAGGDALKQIRSDLNDYKDRLVEIGDIFSTVKIYNSIDRLEDAINAYLSGEMKVALKNIEMILGLESKLQDELLIGRLGQFLIEDEVKRLYKARVGNFQGYKKEEMFHIPFNKHYDMLLVGHTHGNQINIPVLDKINRGYAKFHIGYKAFDDKIFNISRGLGTSKIPIRINVSPQITIFDIE